MHFLTLQLKVKSFLKLLFPVQHIDPLYIVAVYYGVLTFMCTVGLWNYMLFFMLFSSSTVKLDDII